MLFRPSGGVVFFDPLQSKRIFQPGAAGFVGPYDTFEPNITHIYKPARRTLTSYLGDAGVYRRDSDDDIQSFSYLADGEFDVASFNSWLGGANPYVHTVRDQKSGDDITQTNKAQQPLFVLSTQNNHPGMLFDGVNDFMTGAYTNAGALSQPFNIFALAQLDAGRVNDGGYHAILDGDDAVDRGAFFQWGAVSPNSWGALFGTPINGGVSSSNWLIWGSLANGGSSQLRHNKGITASGNAGTEIPNGITIGARYDGAQQYWKGYINEVVVCDPSLADPGAFEDTMNTYWAVY